MTKFNKFLWIFISVWLLVSFWMALAQGQEIIKEPIKKAIVEKTLVEKIDVRLKIELADIAETDTILIREKTAEIINEEIEKNLPEIDTPEIKTPEIKTVHFVWKDIMVGGDVSLVDGKVKVVPVYENRLKGEVR